VILWFLDITPKRNVIRRQEAKGGCRGSASLLRHYAVAGWDRSTDVPEVCLVVSGWLRSLQMPRKA